MKYSDPPANARRRLLRGALAAPVLATVHPGSAWAQGSLMCIQRPAYDTFPPPIEASAAGEDPRFIRVLLSDLTIEGSADARHFVDGSNVAAAASFWNFPFAAGYVGPKAAGEFQEFDRVANQLIGELSYEPPGSASGTPAPGAASVSSVFGGLVHGRRSAAAAAPGAAAAAASTYAVEGKWAAVMSFNAAGEAVGVGIVPSESYAVTESCWSSLRPGMAG